MLAHGTGEPLNGSLASDGAGSWAKNGFHGAGVISEDGRNGEFAQAKGGVARIDGTDAGGRQRARMMPPMN